MQKHGRNLPRGQTAPVLSGFGKDASENLGTPFGPVEEREEPGSSGNFQWESGFSVDAENSPCRSAE
jgi:hypothetical protein